jgi:hypothetical protein
VLVLLYLVLFFVYARKCGPAGGPPTSGNLPEAGAGDTDSGISATI